ncbi:MAG TPA: RnfABCDGE type electron transport complex subunit G [Bacteroidales bacterium]|nr:RnfABCDGE type electron transport complex subunit G [Bacteroidales bacterium]
MSKKIESTLLNMILSLTIIGIVASFSLGFIYEITKKPIETSAKQKVINALKEVLPEFNNDPMSEKEIINDIEIYTGKKNNEITGYAIKTFTTKGFNGLFSLMVGLLPDGTINKIQVLDQKETPGLGTKMSENSFLEQFYGKNPSSFKLFVKKDGGDVDAITASTITSRAFCEAVQKAYDALMKKKSNQKNTITDSTSYKTKDSSSIKNDNL